MLDRLYRIFMLRYKILRKVFFNGELLYTQYIFLHGVRRSAASLSASKTLPPKRPYVCIASIRNRDWRSVFAHSLQHKIGSLELKRAGKQTNITNIPVVSFYIIVAVWGKKNGCFGEHVLQKT